VAFLRQALVFFVLLIFGIHPAIAAQAPAATPSAPGDPQAPQQKEKTAEKPRHPQLPFQIRLLETQIRFETNGDSRKEVHTIVKINNILGVQQFARISFDYNRSFQQVEIPLVRISHANGGTSELLPSAVTDVPNPAVEPFPAYHDVRVKSVRILGLQEGDTVEYRVITTTTKQPLAPDFWLQHTFDRSGQVLEENYELDLPTSRNLDPRINPVIPMIAKESTGSGETALTIYRWKRTYAPPEEGEPTEDATPDSTSAPDIAVSSFTWQLLCVRLADLLLPGSKPIQETKSSEASMKELARGPEIEPAVREKALALTQDSKSALEKTKAVYRFVSTQISTVDLPLGATGFRARPAVDILNSGYAIAEDKYVLFAALAGAVNVRADPVLTGFCDRKAFAIPISFKHLVVLASTKDRQYWLDPVLEVAPFGMISPSDAKCAFLLRRDLPLANAAGQEWISVPTALPFAAFQKVNVDAAIAETGQLSARVKYVLRGQNELMLRVAFHQAPKEKWKDIGTLLSISDGFRGQVTNVQASDPLATDGPFTVEYELTQLKFVDWSKKPVLIPALLPQIGLPDLPLPQAQTQATTSPKIELGTPLDVQTAMTLKLPEGMTAQIPAGTSLVRDYATYTSKYSSSGNTVFASRRVDFLKRQLLGDRAVDYNAFLRAVQNDQSQRLILEPKAKAEN
jgi:Domain of Unknown Function with PDB structure (DUF3857)